MRRGGHRNRAGGERRGPALGPRLSAPTMGDLAQFDDSEQKAALERAKAEARKQEEQKARELAALAAASGKDEEDDEMDFSAPLSFGASTPTIVAKEQQRVAANPELARGGWRKSPVQPQTKSLAQLQAEQRMASQDSTRQGGRRFVLSRFQSERAAPSVSASKKRVQTTAPRPKQTRRVGKLGDQESAAASLMKQRQRLAAQRPKKREKTPPPPAPRQLTERDKLMAELDEMKRDIDYEAGPLPTLWPEHPRGRQSLNWLRDPRVSSLRREQYYEEVTLEPGTFSAVPAEFELFARKKKSEQTAEAEVSATSARLLSVKEALSAEYDEARSNAFALAAYWVGPRHLHRVQQRTKAPRAPSRDKRATGENNKKNNKKNHKKNHKQGDATRMKHNVSKLTADIAVAAESVKEPRPQPHSYLHAARFSIDREDDDEKQPQPEKQQAPPKQQAADGAEATSARPKRGRRDFKKRSRGGRRSRQFRADARTVAATVAAVAETVRAEAVPAETAAAETVLAETVVIGVETVRAEAVPVEAVRAETVIDAETVAKTVAATVVAEPVAEPAVVATVDADSSAATARAPRGGRKKRLPRGRADRSARWRKATGDIDDAAPSDQPKQAAEKPRSHPRGRRKKPKQAQAEKTEKTEEPEQQKPEKRRFRRKPPRNKTKTMTEEPAKNSKD